MECPACGHEKRRVVDSRPSMGSVYRRSECLKCMKRFTTLEIIVEKAKIKKDWPHEMYDDDGIRVATTTRRLYG